MPKKEADPVPAVQTVSGPSARYWSTYQLAFLAVLAFALVAAAAGVVFSLLQATPPAEGEIPASTLSLAPTAPAQGESRILGSLPAELGEGSGIAFSPSQNLIWVHNDDPGPAVLFAVDLDGRLRGSYEISGVAVMDFEDLNLAPCPSQEAASCLYIGDTGDNERIRPEARIVAVTEPVVGGRGPELVGDVRFSYADGTPRDIESLAVADGRILLVSKGQEGRSDVFEVRVDAMRQGGEIGAPVTARHVATLDLDTSDDQNRPTGAAVSPDGSTLGVRTAQTMYRFSLEDLTAPPVSCPIGADEPQGEAVAFLDDQRVLLTGERGGGSAPAPIVELACPASGSGPDQQ